MLRAGSPRLALIALVLAACGGDPEPAPTDDDDVPSDEGTSEQEPDAGGLDARVSDARVPDARVRADDAGTTPVDAGSEPDDAGTTPVDAGTDSGTRDAGARDASTADAGNAPLSPAFHIPLRVHRGDSGLTGRVLASVMEEVNEIWWRQAGICFEIDIVKDDRPRTDGFDLWFHRSRLGCNTTANGVYCGDHDIHSLDAPSLGRANTPAWNVRQLPARTAAHELGHGLNLPHFNDQPDSNDSLMSSGRQGFKLHTNEIDTARRRARAKAPQEGPSTPCAAVPVVD